MNGTDIPITQPKPKHESEVTEAAERALYGKIIDEMNKVTCLHLGQKLNVIANVVDSIGNTVRNDGPDAKAKLNLRFIGVLAEVATRD